MLTGSTTAGSPLSPFRLGSCGTQHGGTGVRECGRELGAELRTAPTGPPDPIPWPQLVRPCLEGVPVLVPSVTWGARITISSRSAGPKRSGLAGSPSE